MSITGTPFDIFDLSGFSREKETIDNEDFDNGKYVGEVCDEGEIAKKWQIHRVKVLTDCKNKGKFAKVFVPLAKAQRVTEGAKISFEIKPNKNESDKKMLYFSRVEETGGAMQHREHFKLFPLYYDGYDASWNLHFYISEADGAERDRLSNLLLDFKNNSSKVVASYCQLAQRFLEKEGMEFDYIVRAIGSDELRATGSKSLDVLGNFLADKFAAQYTPLSIYKTRAIPSLKGYHSGPERRKLLEGVYAVDNHYPIPDGATILVIDDVTTTDATAQAIFATLAETHSWSKIYFLALARTQHQEDCNAEIRYLEGFFR